MCLGASFVYEAFVLSNKFGDIPYNEKVRVVKESNSLGNIFDNSFSLFNVIAFAYILYKLLCHIDLLIGG